MGLGAHLQHCENSKFIRSAPARGPSRWSALRGKGEGACPPPSTTCTLSAHHLRNMISCSSCSFNVPSWDGPSQLGLCNGNAPAVKPPAARQAWPSQRRSLVPRHHSRPRRQLCRGGQASATPGPTAPVQLVVLQCLRSPTQRGPPWSALSPSCDYQGEPQGATLIRVESDSQGPVQLSNYSGGG